MEGGTASHARIYPSEIPAEWVRVRSKANNAFDKKRTANRMNSFFINYLMKRDYQYRVNSLLRICKYFVNEKP
jgi:hypothetical protein